ncbi:HMG (high mobility group) box [Ceratocystis lukuohia]|uniref:HMG (High mobility group) box n=1 Tax=Ceratocystis lukuohia TaxID=2019550 RepID=A0ABR4MGR1_9PEZI
MMPSAEPTSSNSVSGVCPVTAGATYPSQYGMGDSVRASEDDGMEYPAPSSTENIDIPGPAADEPQSQSSHPEDESRNSSEPVSAVVDRVENAPSHRKRGARKPARRHSLTIRTPLAQLAGQFPRIQIPDINVFVNRPVEERFRELDTAKNPSEGKRPMNAFLLYRKAYQRLAKTIYGQKNHQYVSQICGDSWKIESRAVRDLFNDLAITERINQHMACRAYTERVSSDIDDSECTSPAMDADGGDSGLDIGELGISSPLHFGGDAALHRNMVPGSAFPSSDESSPLVVVDESPIFVVSDDSPLFSAPVDSPLFAAFARSALAGANSGVGVGTWQTGLSMPIININQPPPLPVPEFPLDTSSYQHPLSIELEASFSASEEGVDPALEPSEQGSFGVGNGVPTSQEPENAGEDWVYYPPAPGTFSMAPGLGGI